jgi:hypothetical protein
MSGFEAYLWVVLGVFVAVVFPIIKAWIAPKPEGVVARGLPPWAVKYLKILAFALVTGVIVLAIYLAASNEDPLQTARWFTLFLLGFSWESTIEKFMNKP